MPLSITKLKSPPIWEMPVEIVERKGKGHPDYICDKSAEEVSRSLCRFYVEKFGAILHHNVDKAILIGGSSNPRFGGGEVTKPIKIILAGRAVKEVQGSQVPIDELVGEAIKSWLREEIRNLDVGRHLIVSQEIKPGSPALVSTFSRGGEIPLSNDTSLGVGFAPLSPLEKVVRETEEHLNSRKIKEKHPWTGEDIKVLGLRKGRDIYLTVACAFISRLVTDLDSYIEYKRTLKDLILKFTSGLTDLALNVILNAADEERSGSVYITVTGTSAEGGDDGQVGRGNRVNGLITPYRPMTMEAAAGKNPISHVGKLYNITARNIAEDMSAIEGIEETYCYMVSQIGKPITEPQIVEVKVRTKRPLGDLKKEIGRKVEERISGLPYLWRDLIYGNIPIF